jgi:hypothetical protein
MEGFSTAVKAVFLATAMAIVGSAVFSSPGYARQTECEEYGHACHAVVNGQTIHLKYVE